MTKRRVGILISGRGSNLGALIEACRAPSFPAKIVLVISNMPSAQGLLRAESALIPTRTVNHKDFPTREAFDETLDKALHEAGVEILCNAGFMRLHTEGFVKRWWDRHLNIHPSLLPAFKGLHTHERVLEAGARISGCTVHFVRPEMDEGPIIAQAAVPVLPDDTPDTLGARVLEAEHRLYPLALGLVAAGKIRVEGERVVGMTQVRAQTPLFSPLPEVPFD
jgi:phosphoribosylglycinamide formyltransferase-1